MKLIRIFLLLFIPVVALGQTSTNEEWKILKQLNYSLEYPASWELVQSGQMGTQLILFSSLEFAEDPFKENINLIIQDLAGYNIDLDAYAKLSEEQIKTLINNSRILEGKKITVNDNPCYKIVYTGEQGIFHLTFEQYYFIIDNKAYVLTFTCEESKFDKFKEAGERILNSFKVKK